MEAAMNGEAQGAYITFPKVELLWKVVTSKRLAILRVMTGGETISIREVARRVERDVKAVHADVRALVNAGLVEVIEIEVAIAADPDELAGTKISLLRKHQLKGGSGHEVEGFPVTLFGISFAMTRSGPRTDCQDRTGAGGASRTTASGLGLAERVIVGLISNNAEGAPLVA